MTKSNRNAITQEREPSNADVLAAIEQLRRDVLLAIRPEGQRARALRDEADERLFMGLASLGGTFQVEDVITHGKLNQPFQALLEAADVCDTLTLGYWLRKHRGRVFEGRQLETSDKDENGAIWSFLTI